MVRYLIKNGIILTMDKTDRVFRGSVAVDKGRIVDLGRTGDIEQKHRHNEIIDASDKIVMPGLVNCHIHSDSVLFRGLEEDMTIHQFYRDKLWVRLTKHIRQGRAGEYLGYAALLTFIESLKSGTTFVADISYAETSLRPIIQGFRRVGIRGCVFAYNLAQLEELSRQDDGSVILGMELPNEEMLCQEELVARKKALKKSFLVHMHLAETKKRADLSKKRFKKSTMRVLQDNGLLSERSIMSHAIWITKGDVKIMQRKRSKVVCTPTSEMKLNDGISPILKLINSSVPVGLGTDGAAYNNCNDMFREMKTLCLLQKVTHGANSFSAYQALRMATIDGAKIFNMENQIGSLEIGKKADIILIDAGKPHMRPLVLEPRSNIIPNIVYSACGHDVETVLVDGKLVMENRVLTRIDEKRITGELQNIVDGILSCVRLDSRVD